jgi:hypothetical protein
MTNIIINAKMILAKDAVDTEPAMRTKPFSILNVLSVIEFIAKAPIDAKKPTIIA